MVRIHITAHCTTSLETVVVSGSTAELGEWDPEKATSLARDADSGVWRGSFSSPAGIHPLAPSLLFMPPCKSTLRRHH